MAYKRVYNPDPVLLGDYAYDAAQQPSIRENTVRTYQGRQQQAELAQRAAIASGQFAQHSADRAAQFASHAMNRDARLAEAGIGAQRDVALKQLEGQQAGQEFQQKLQGAEHAADLEARNDALSKIIPVDASEGAVQAHELAIANKRLLGIPQQAFEEELLQKAAAGDEEAVKMGVAAGILGFSPQQKEEQAKLRAAMAEVESNPTLHPMDRARAQRDIAARLAAIRPQPVPGDERTPTLEQQLQQSIGIWTDPTTGKQYPMTLNRNGVPEILDLNKNVSKQDSKPATMAEKAASDPAYKQKLFDDARTRVLERKKQEFEAATALAAQTPGAPMPQPNLTVNNDEIIAEVRNTLAMEQAFDGTRGGGQTMTQPPGGPMQGGATQQPRPQQAPPPAVAAGIQAFAQHSGQPIPNPPAAQPPRGPVQGPQPPQQTPQPGVPQATPKPKAGLNQQQKNFAMQFMQKLIAKANAQGYLDPDDAETLKRLSEDLGIPVQFAQ